MNPWEIIAGCMIGGVILVMFELILPGGVLGAIGGVLILIGTFTAGKHYGVGAAGGLFLASALIVSVAFYVLYRSPFGQILVLKDQLAHPESIQELKVGDSGVTTTDLRPTGKACFVINGRERSFDVMTEGQFLGKQDEVLVSKIEGQKIIVFKKGAPHGV